MPSFDIDSNIPPEVIQLDGYRYRSIIGAMIYVSMNPSTGGPSPAPLIENVLPVPTGSRIDPTQVVELDITDESDSFRRIILVIEFTNHKVKEVVFDGLGFGPMYQGSGNAQNPIFNGFHFTLQRDGGWLTGPMVMTPFAIDTSGSENT